MREGSVDDRVIHVLQCLLTREADLKVSMTVIHVLRCLRSFPKDSQKLLSGFTISKMLLGIDWNARRVCHTDQSITCRRSLVDARSCFLDARSCIEASTKQDLLPQQYICLQVSRGFWNSWHLCCDFCWVHTWGQMYLKQSHWHS